MIQGLLLQLPVLLFSIVVHECAHGLVASWRGDDTAREEGRITLNPMAHMDPVGTIVLPLLLIATRSSFLFGWAKPVPVNVGRLRDPQRDHLYVSISGPLSNLLLGVVFVFAYMLLSSLISHTSPFSSTSNLLTTARRMMFYGVHINALLAAFNILPIPPLDGSWVLYRLLPSDLAERYASIFPYGFIILILLLMTGALGMVLYPLTHLALGIITMVVSPFALFFH